jgi:hypothetical protein
MPSASAYDLIQHSPEILIRDDNGIGGDRAICVSDDPIKDRRADGAGIDVEAARAPAKGLDRRVDFKLVDGSEIDKPDSTWAIYLRLP